MGVRHGNKTTTINVKRIGKHSELLSITDDPLAYAKEEVEKMNKESKKNKLDLNITIDFNQKVFPSDNVKSVSTSQNIGFFFLQYIYSKLKIDDFITNITKDRKITFDSKDINKIITFSRILDPCSKLSCWDKKNHYFGKHEFQYQHILRFMDILAPHFDDYLKHLYTNSLNLIKRDTSVLYFDCTNFYFEIDDEDDDYIDETTGELIKGLRKFGISKENRPNPIVQMGLFMDRNGIPLHMCINSGSDNEQKCVIPSEYKLNNILKDSRFIYCADSGLSSYDIKKFNSYSSKAYVITQSIKKLSKTMQEAVFNDADFKLLSNDKSFTIAEMKNFDRNDQNNLNLYNDKLYKFIDAEHKVDIGLTEEKKLKNGKTKTVKSKATLKEKILITFSRKQMEYQRHIRNKQIERAKALINSQNIDKLKKGPNDVGRFIKRSSKSKNGDDVIDVYTLNLEQIKNEEKYDGFYAIATNLDDDAATIISINAERYRIEDCFRTLKTYFNARPVCHRLDDNIKVHFLTCYTALLVFKILETKINDNQFSQRFTIEEIIETLKNMNVSNCNDIYYESNYRGSKICTVLNEVFDLKLDRRYYKNNELEKILKKISR